VVFLLGGKIWQFGQFFTSSCCKFPVFFFFNSLTFREKVTGNFCHIFTEFPVMGHTNQSLSKVLYFSIPKIHNTIIMFSLSSLGGKLVAKIKTSSNATFKMRVLKVVG